MSHGLTKSAVSQQNLHCASGCRTRSRDERWRAWIRQIARGDSDALADFYDETASYLYRQAVRVLRDPTDAEEVVLDVYARVWQRAADFDESRGNVSQWLTVLVRSRAIDRLRSRTLRRSFETELTDPDSLAGQESPEQAVEVRRRQRRVRIALDALPQEQREAIELAHLHGFTHAELAARLGAPLGTVKTRIRLGMMKLRDALQSLESDVLPAA